MQPTGEKRSITVAVATVLALSANQQTAALCLMVTEWWGKREKGQEGKGVGEGYGNLSLPIRSIFTQACSIVLHNFIE